MVKRKRKSHYHRGDYVSQKSGETHTYRSGWEFLLMKYLDADQDIVSWSYESIVIEYVSNSKTGRRRKYYPDLYVEL